MPQPMLTIYHPVRRTMTEQPCRACGFNRYEVILVEQHTDVPVELFGNVMTGLGKAANAYLKVISERSYEAVSCLRCAQPADEDPYEDDAAGGE